MRTTSRSISRRLEADETVADHGDRSEAGGQRPLQSDRGGESPDDDEPVSTRSASVCTTGVLGRLGAVTDRIIVRHSSRRAGCSCVSWSGTAGARVGGEGRGRAPIPVQCEGEFGKTG